MGSGRSKNPTVAGILSAIVPGLGQFYCRQWWKGAGFLIGALAVDTVFGVSSGMFDLLQSVGTSPPMDGFGKLLLGALLFLLLAIWSILDAVRTAKRSI